MARAIVMPVMGMYTEEGVLTAWLRPAGERVEAGDAVAEITTEKSAFEIPAPTSGILHPVVEVGSNLRVESLMGYILVDGEPVPPIGAESDSKENDREIQRGRPAQPETDGTGNAPTQTQTDKRPVASPVARRLASQHGIDLTVVKGTGPGGRIVESDVRALVAVSDGDRRVLRRVPMAGSRRTISEFLRATVSAAISTTLTREVDADVFVLARRQLAEKMHAAPSPSALFIKLLATALRDFPEWNSAVDGDSIVTYSDINIGFAVAAPRGLIVPVVKQADSVSISEISDIVRSLTDKAMNGRLSPSDVEGGTASISNLGAYGIDAFTPILNGPQSVILGIGRVAERPVARNGALSLGHTCVLSLTFDHRVADGVPAARLLDSIARQMNDEHFFAALIEA
jgi:pyruvate/2-oxoglutarate dehydrogenase complex dihydrolipoamide acyltransferase (E2) component